MIKPELMENWKTQLGRAKYLIVQARTGRGKTTFAKAFVNAYYPRHLIVSCEEDWKTDVTAYIRENEKKKQLMIVLDDFQEIAQLEKNLELTADFLKETCEKAEQCQFLILSRGGFPKRLNELLGQQAAYAAVDFDLDMEQTRMLMQNRGLTPQDVMVETCLAWSEGDPWFTMIWINYMCAGLDDMHEIYRRAMQDYYERWDRIRYKTRMLPMFQMMISLSVFDCLTPERAEILLGAEEARAFFKMASIGTSSFEYQPDGTIQLHWFFLAYLRRHFQKLPDQMRKDYYSKAAEYYEKKGDIVQAVRCYDGAENEKKVIEMVILLAENADENIFAREGCKYMDGLQEDVVRENPKLIMAKAMLAAYRLRTGESEQWIEEMRQFISRHPDNKEARRSYYRMQIALPYGRAEKIQGWFQTCVDEFGLENAAVQNVAPTGGMPGVLNGRIDFCSFLSDVEGTYLWLKKLAVPVLGEEAEGWAEVFMGETAYQKNDRIKAIAYLTQGLSNANLRGTQRMQYAAIGVMSRLFMAEGQPDTAISILENLYAKVKKAGSYALLSNIRCSETLCRLREGDLSAASSYMCIAAEDDGKELLISDRYSMYTAAVSCLALGRYAEALFRLRILQDLTEKYHYAYLQWKVQLLTAVVLCRRGEEWKPLVIRTVSELAAYDMVRLAADEGAALLPLWKAVDWSETSLAEKKEFRERAEQALKQEAARYPSYLDPTGGLCPLTAQEKRVLSLMAEGMTNIQIAEQMDLSVSTVKKYVSFIYQKLDVDNRAGAVRMGYQHNLI